MSERFDLVVIGSGPAGEKGAAQAAFFGKRVAMVERDPSPGGTAARGAVIPSKTLRETALYLTGFRNRQVYGVSLSLDPEVTLAHLVERKDQVVRATTDAVRRNLDRHHIELIEGTASLGPDRTVVVEGPAGRRELAADVVLIATGSRPHRPPGVPFEDPDVRDSDEILQLDRIPRSLAVVGGGVIGCEYASIFRALGSEVTLVDGRDRLVPFLDGEMSTMLADCFAILGLRVVLGRSVERVGREDGGLAVHLSDGEVLKPDVVLYAAGQAGNTEGLGLEAAGVTMDARGRIVVGPDFLTSAPGVYAAGDVIGKPSLASVSMEQGRVAMCHAFDIPFKETVDPLAPYGVYTIPEVAMVGLTEEAARADGEDIEVGVGRFADNPRALIAGFTEGAVKLVFRRSDRMLLGVHILGDLASELIHIGQAVMHSQGTIDHFIHATFNVPTRADAYKYAAYDGLQRLSGREVR